MYHWIYTLNTCRQKNTHNVGTYITIKLQFISQSNMSHNFSFRYFSFWFWRDYGVARFNSSVTYKAFTNCVHGYDRAPNVDANGVTRHENSCTVLIPLCKNNLNMQISHIDHYALRKRKATTTGAFLISNTVLPNSYSHSAAVDPKSFTPLSSVSG